MGFHICRVIGTQFHQDGKLNTSMNLVDLDFHKITRVNKVVRNDHLTSSEITNRLSSTVSIRYYWNKNLNLRNQSFNNLKLVGLLLL